MGDFVRAEQLFSEAMQGVFISSDEQPVADQMLDAYDDVCQPWIRGGVSSCGVARECNNRCTNCVTVAAVTWNPN
jgi:hypothetical protein